MGLLVQGKSDFDAIEGYQGDKFFKDALGIALLPSSPTLRQRMDAKVVAMLEHVPGLIGKRSANPSIPAAVNLRTLLRQVQQLQAR